jgi:hypothetical protein
MAADNMVLVYRFACAGGGAARLSPQHMWGTLEAIATLTQCEPLMETERPVHAKLLENGFYFEHTKSNYQRIDDPAR